MPKMQEMYSWSEIIDKTWATVNIPGFIPDKDKEDFG
jgi:hypothetical protein